MQFIHIATDTEHRFSLGRERESGKPFLSIPVSNSYVDYEEYYEINEKQLDEWKVNMQAALPFVEECRMRKRDGQLFQKPGKYRGVPQ